VDLIFYAIIGGIFLIVLILLIIKQNKNTQIGPIVPTLERHIPKELYETIVAQNDMLRSDLAEKEQQIRDYGAQLAAKEQTLFHLQETLKTQKEEVSALQEKFKTEFENIANRLLEEKSQSFTQQNSAQLQTVLLPLREKIKDFEENIEKKFLEETREKSSLKKELEQLHNLNQQLSQDAHNLASALKGQSKTQGDWGEYQLELVLEKAGLTKGIHYYPQLSFRDETGQIKRPDFLIQLPDNKQLIIDSKVSLTAFERFMNEPDATQRDKHLRAHVQSLRTHIQDLSSKNYQMLDQINSPDYLLLFVPLDSALNAATQADPKLFNDAMERNIILVTTSSLLATMRTVAHLWKQEKQTRSVLDIAKQSGLLYDKFVGFVEDLKMIGTRLTGAQIAYDDAMQKLVNSPRYGDTLIGRAEKIRELGAKATKVLPKELTDKLE
jgi:DNA recombination protein RmuC